LNSLFAFAASSDIVVQAARKAAFSSDGVDYSVSNNLCFTITIQLKNFLTDQKTSKWCLKSKRIIIAVSSYTLLYYFQCNAIT